MKIKRWDNVWIMGLVVMAIITAGLLILKIIFPEFVVETAQSEWIVSLGEYIDTHKWAWYVASAILSIIMNFFYCCACCKKKTLSKVEWCYILLSIVISFAIREHSPQYYTTANWCFAVLLPCIMHCDPIALGVCFTVNILGQATTLYIRNIISMVANYNFATLLVLMIDLYIWLILLYFIFNFKKKESE